MHPEYLILITFPWQKWLSKRASMLRYIYIACLLFFIIIGLNSDRLEADKCNLIKSHRQYDFSV
jgi:hypothetical protein